jgi:MSHA biogenesis protein MshO
MRLTKHALGFTIVELITVMVIMGILSVGTVRFISDGANGFATTLSRAALVSDAQQLITRLSRDVREALPSSIRVSVSGDCLELIPIVGASVYLSAPIGSTASSMQVVPLDGAVLSANSRVALAPTSNPYSLTTLSSISPTVTVAAADVNNEVAISFSSPHQFTQASAQNRFYLVESPVSYCRQGGALWRYQNYGFLAAQPIIASLPSTLPNRSLVAESIDPLASIFDFTGATLQRNATVTLNLQLQNGGDELAINHLVQLRNLP